jgi:dihydrofolate reductase
MKLGQSLMHAGLVAEYVLMITPLVLGTGFRLFPDGGAFSKLRLVEATTSTTGVIMATYRPA